MTRSYNVERARTTYLRFPLVASESRVTVYAPDGRRVGDAKTWSGARRIVKGYRKVQR